MQRESTKIQEVHLDGAHCHENILLSVFLHFSTEIKKKKIIEILTMLNSFFLRLKCPVLKCDDKDSRW